MAIVSYYRTQLEDWLKELDIKANTVLDIGGKQGNVKDRVKSWDVQEYEVLDLPDFDIQNPPYVTPRANIIFCLEVFEYLTQPQEALNTISELLLIGGKAYITFAFIYPHHNELDMDSLRYTEPGVRRLCEAAGLRITNNWYRRDRSGLLKAFYASDGMKMAKQYSDHDVTGFIVEVTK